MKKIILPEGFGKPTYEELTDFVTSPDNDSATFEEKIIAMFLRDYRPADGSETKRCDLTSFEIQTRLEDIAGSSQGHSNDDGGFRIPARPRRVRRPVLANALRQARSGGISRETGTDTFLHRKSFTDWPRHTRVRPLFLRVSSQIFYGIF